MDKQIEELMKVMCVDFPCNRVCDQYCGMYDYAERAIKAGYRKIPENAVVLTREEAEKVYNIVKEHKKVWEDVKELKADFTKEMYALKKDLEKDFEEHEQAVRKETADKFAERLKADGQCGYSMGIKIYTIEEKGIDEIAKEIMGGK